MIPLTTIAKHSLQNNALITSPVHVCSVTWLIEGRWKLHMHLMSTEAFLFQLLMKWNSNPDSLHSLHPRHYCHNTVSNSGMLRKCRRLISPLPVFGSVNITPLPLSQLCNWTCISTITKKSNCAKKKLGGLMKSDWKGCEAAKGPQIKASHW